MESADAIRHRLGHVVTYLETLKSVPVCDKVDEAWVENFRIWFRAQPIVSPTGKERIRSESTVENSVLQLSAAINWGRKRGHTLLPAQFRSTPTKQVNRTPVYRADMDTLIAMFRYASETRLHLRRQNLLRFLRISVVTMARPDAAHDFNFAPARKQWQSAHRVLLLNPHGRRQTKKIRAVVPVPDFFAAEIDALVAEARAGDDGLTIATGHYIPVHTVKSAFETMMIDLDIPRDGEAGMKLIRRSVAHMVRGRMSDRGVAEQDMLELQMFLGHNPVDTISELYAPTSPTYLARVRREIESICAEVHAAVPGAFYRTVTAPSLKIVGGEG